MKRYLPFTIIIVVLVVAVAGFSFFWKRSSGSGDANTTFVNTNQPPSSPSGSPAATQSLPQAAPTIPNIKVTSPVVVEEYGDYQCPPCGALYPDLKKIESEYSDKIRFEFHYLPLTKIHKNAFAAARAAEAAHLQNKFWQMHDHLYLNQKAWVDLDDPRPVFVSYAKELGLNINQFQTDMEGNRVEQAIVSDLQKAEALGIHRTPTI